MTRTQILVVAAVVLMVLALAACGYKSGQVTQLSLAPAVEQLQDDQQPGDSDDSGDSVLPALDDDALLG